MVVGLVSGHGVSFTRLCTWGDDVFFLMSCSADRSVAMLRAICSCFSVSCSTLRFTTARSRGIASSWCANSGDVVAAAGADAGGDFIIEIDDNQPSDGVQVLTISIASSPLDSQTDDPPIPIRAATKQAATARSARPPIDEPEQRGTTRIDGSTDRKPAEKPDPSRVIPMP
jgi:hypothetical protein